MAAICKGTDGQFANQHTIHVVATLTSPMFHELTSAQIGWAATQVLDECAARSLIPPPSPAILLGPYLQRPLSACVAAAKAATVWDSAHCIILEPPLISMPNNPQTSTVWANRWRLPYSQELNL